MNQRDRKSFFSFGGRNQLAQAVVGRTLEVTEPAVLQTMLELDKYDGVGASAAGALATAALPQLTGLLEGQTVVVIVSGR